MRIGVLALQGDFALHAKALERCGVEAVEVRKPAELGQVDGLIMPGGESTTLLKLMDAWDFVPAIEKFHRAAKPIFGTCAGLILLAGEVQSPTQSTLVLTAGSGERESFEASGTAKLGPEPTQLEMVFIRAPRIKRVGPGVDVLAERNGEPVMARQDRVLVATFHPELTDETKVHRYFCDMVDASRVVA